MNASPAAIRRLREEAERLDREVRAASAALRHTRALLALYEEATSEPRRRRPAARPMLGAIPRDGSMERRALDAVRGGVTTSRGVAERVYPDEPAGERVSNRARCLLHQLKLRGLVRCLDGRWVPTTSDAMRDVEGRPPMIQANEVADTAAKGEQG